MGYDQLVGHLSLPSSSSAESLTSAAVIKRNAVLEPCIVRRLMFVVKTAVVSSGNVVITLKRYPTFGSSSSAATLGTLSIPTGAAAGAVYYKDLDSVKLNFGDELIVEVTTAAAGGGAAGDGMSGVNLYHASESPQNSSDMIASA